METNLELPVTYKGKEWMLPMKLITSGYTWRFAVQVRGGMVWVEKDEEGELRVLAQQPDQADKLDVSPELVAAIVHSISQII
jgi:hypothetical protein